MVKVSRFIAMAVLALGLLFIVSGCRKGQYSPLTYYSQQELDSLVTDMVVYIGKKPKYANHITRHEAEYRNYYVNYSKNFDLVYYHVSPTGKHLFYMIRPARSVHGNLRGVGGQFRLDDNNRIYDFVEFFNTQIMGRDELLDIGLDLFKYMVNHGNADALIGNREIIEWPDNRCVYDKSINEWVYID